MTTFVVVVLGDVAPLKIVHSIDIFPLSCWSLFVGHSFFRSCRLLGWIRRERISCCCYRGGCFPRCSSERCGHIPGSCSIGGFLGCPLTFLWGAGLCMALLRGGDCVPRAPVSSPTSSFGRDRRRVVECVAEVALFQSWLWRGVAWLPNLGLLGHCPIDYYCGRIDVG